VERAPKTSAWKWIAYATAILSLIAGIRQTGKMISERLENQRRIDALLATERLQLEGKDYGAAWKSLEQASKIDAESGTVRSAQEALAIEWLDNVRSSERERPSSIAQKVEPVLTRGAASEKNTQRQGDLLAHIGWTYFLRIRDGQRGLDPAGPYAKAVAADTNNPYAQAMWGHWILWNGCKPGEAESHFASALVSNREKELVRRMQLSALLNQRVPACEDEVVRVLDAMRKEQGSVDAIARDRIFSIYYTRLIPFVPDSASFLNAVAPTEHIATFQWLFGRLVLDASNTLLRMYFLSNLQEAAGQRDEALQGYRTIRSQLPGRGGTLASASDAAIKRLAAGKPAH
jgi:hypothetical protein